MVTIQRKTMTLLPSTTHKNEEYWVFSYCMFFDTHFVGYCVSYLADNFIYKHLIITY